MANIDIQEIKNRYNITGNNAELNQSIRKAIQIADTDLPVLITGESGVGKESFPKLIHDFSPRKHKKYVIVNCGAIPEGTMDSELFGHIKGSFTGALNDRQGYFEVANGGTIFLDEVGELPLQTQARLLRVLQYGEYYRVGSSEVMKTDVRVVAATNVNLLEAIREGKFRQDLYYRLNAIPIYVPPLRERKKDIHILFTRFANDFADKYHRPAIRLQPDAMEKLENYYWQGNIRQLKNVVEQMSAIEIDRDISAETLENYLPDESESRLPIIAKGNNGDFSKERELLYALLHKLDEQNKTYQEKIDALERAVSELQNKLAPHQTKWKSAQVYEPLEATEYTEPASADSEDNIDTDSQEQDKEPVSMEDMQKQMILESLKRHNNNRKLVSTELGISERTLYRKLKDYGIN